MKHFARCALSCLHVERSPRADRRPQSLPLPASFRIVDSTVEPFGVETGWIWHAEDDELAVLQRQQTFRCVAGIDRRVGTEAGRIELIDPGVIACFRAAGVGHVLQLRQRFLIESPALRTLLPGRSRTVERSPALASIE